MSTGPELDEWIGTVSEEGVGVFICWDIRVASSSDIFEVRSLHAISVCFCSSESMSACSVGSELINRVGRIVCVCGRKGNRSRPSESYVTVVPTRGFGIEVRNNLMGWSSLQFYHNQLIHTKITHDFHPFIFTRYITLMLIGLRVRPTANREPTIDCTTM